MAEENWERGVIERLATEGLLEQQRARRWGIFFKLITLALVGFALFLLLAVIVVMAVSTYARFYLISWVGERVVADIRRDVFSHLLELSPAFFEQARTGEVISRLTADTALLEQVVGTSLSMAVRMHFSAQAVL
jgi:ABC-type multidrug transport system fused ATPase/permease subunit